MFKMYIVLTKNTLLIINLTYIGGHFGYMLYACGSFKILSFWKSAEHILFLSKNNNSFQLVTNTLQTSGN